MSIYKDCDVRGIYPKEITGRDSYRIGRALATCTAGEWIAGGDVRLSTPELKEALIRGLRDSGADITDIGTVPTPVMYYSLRRSGAAGGAMVTASHNPPEYNGIKFMIGNTPVNREIMDTVHDIVSREAFREETGSVRFQDPVNGYMSFLTERFHADRERPLHVLIDAGNGCMSRIAPAVFRACGYRVTELNCTPDGSFPGRSPNPADFTCLGPTGEAVRSSGADFAVAFDGDGDRAVFLDERGNPVLNEKSLVLFIRYLLKDRPSSVVYDQKSSSIVRKAILETGSEPLPDKSGHAFIKTRFLKHHSALAGEVSGHFFFGELGYDDGLFAALTMAELLSRASGTLGELTDSIVCPPITPDIRFSCPYPEQDACLERARKIAAESGAVISCLDGIRADFPDGWFLIRKSVTAEQITLRAEAETEARLNEIVRLAQTALPEHR